MRRSSSLKPVYALFFLSGLAALVYQVVWTRWLILVFGATVYSASTVLAAFMAGSALGSLWGARLSRARSGLLALYGRLELGIGAAAALFPLGVHLVFKLVEATDLPLGPLRFIAVFALLLPPAVLMGATFPVLSQHAVRGEAGRGVGELYAANLLGAAMGTLGGAFLLIPFIGLWGAHAAAVVLNLAVGAAALRIAGAGPSSSTAAPAGTAPMEAADRAPGVAVAAVFASGLCGMASEVVWTRILVPLFNNSAYGFASVVFVYLTGLGAGSFLASRLRAGERGLLGILIALSALLALVGYQTLELAHLLYLRFATHELSSAGPPVMAPLMEVLVSLTPHAVLQGMILPVAVRQLGPVGGAGAAVGRLYSWNTAGAILGALAAGFWWIPSFDVQNSLFILTGVAALTGSALAFLGSRRPWVRAAVPAGTMLLGVLGWAPLRGRHLPTQLLLDWSVRHPDVDLQILHRVEDLEGSVGVLAIGPTRTLLVNGVTMTLYTNATKMMAHLPLLLHPAPRRTLVVCFGMGTTFRSAMRHGGTVDVVDLVKGVFDVFPFFYKDAGRWTSDPRGRLIVNDGRNHLLREREGYDVITVDPAPPLYAAGTVNLYSRDFFLLARRRLKPGGLLAVWVPSIPDADFKMILKGFVEAMPFAEFWLATKSFDGVLLIGSESPVPLDPARVRARMRRPGIKEDLLELDREFESDSAFWRLYLGPAERFRDYLADARPVTDGFPWIEYPYFRAGLPGYEARSPIFDWPPYKIKRGRPTP